MRNSVLLLVLLLLPACASAHKAGGANGATPGVHKSDAEPQPATRQLPMPVEVQQSARSDQVDHPPIKRKHNIEED